MPEQAQKTRTAVVVVIEYVNGKTDTFTELFNEETAHAFAVRIVDNAKKFPNVFEVRVGDKHTYGIGDEH